MLIVTNSKSTKEPAIKKAYSILLTVNVHRYVNVNIPLLHLRHKLFIIFYFSLNSTYMCNKFQDSLLLPKVYAFVIFTDFA